jgi:hypothetical protein
MASMSLWPKTMTTQTEELQSGPVHENPQCQPGKTKMVRLNLYSEPRTNNFDAGCNMANRPYGIEDQTFEVENIILMRMTFRGK